MIKWFTWKFQVEIQVLNHYSKIVWFPFLELSVLWWFREVDFGGGALNLNESDWSFERVFQISQETIEILNLENAGSSYPVFDICRSANNFCYSCWFDCSYHERQGYTENAIHGRGQTNRSQRLVINGSWILWKSKRKERPNLTKRDIFWTKNLLDSNCRPVSLQL